MASSDSERLVLNRRRLIQAAGLGATAAAPSQTAARTAWPAVPTPALVAENISVAAIQRTIVSVQEMPAAKAIAANVQAMRDAIDRVQASGVHKHLITFSGYALQGGLTGALNDLTRTAIAADGPEVAGIAAKAREHGSHVSFGAWATDPDWRGRVIAMTILIGPDGKTIAKDWAPLASDAGAFHWASAVESEFDAYIEMYGAGAVLPVHQTGIGVVAQAPVQGAPEIFRAYALKGAEIFLRTAPDSCQSWDLQAAAGHNRCFSVMTTAAAAPSDHHAAFAGTAIHGPGGEVLAEAGSKWDQVVVASLPMARYRSVHRIPNLATALFLPAYERAAV